MEKKGKKKFYKGSQQPQGSQQGQDRSQQQQQQGSQHPQRGSQQQQHGPQQPQSSHDDGPQKPEGPKGFPALQPTCKSGFPALAPSAEPAQPDPKVFKPSAPSSGPEQGSPTLSAAAAVRVETLPSVSVQPSKPELSSVSTQPAQASSTSSLKKKKKKKVKSQPPEESKRKEQESSVPVGLAAPTDGKKGKKPDKSVEPVASSAQIQAPVTSSKDSSTSKDISKKKHIDKVYELPIRKETEHNPKWIARRMIIEVNYLPIKINNPKLSIYHYDVAVTVKLKDGKSKDAPKGLLRPALNVMKNKHFPRRSPAFDGRKNMYVAGTPLDFKGSTLRDTVTITDPETGNDRQFDIAITLINRELNLDSLLKYIKDGYTVDCPQDVIQATDVAMRGCLADNFLIAGRSFFPIPRRDARLVDLGGGLDLWHGFFQSAIMAKKPYLNVDVANHAFPKEQDVIEFLKFVLRATDQELSQGLEPRKQSSLLRFIKGLKIEYRMPSGTQGYSKRVYKVTGLGPTAVQHRFTQEEGGKRQISVAEYFQTVKGTRLRYINLPLLEVGSKGTMLPLEFCTVISKQVIMRKLDERQTSQMVRTAATSTIIRKQRIMENINLARYNFDPTLKEFGIQISNQFEQVEAVVLQPPSIEYRNREIVRVRDGVWRREKEKFYLSNQLMHWGVLITDNRCYMQNVNRLIRELINGASNVGIDIQDPFNVVQMRNAPTEANIVKELENFKKNGAQLVVVVLSPFDQFAYGNIKRAAEFKAGVLTQCIKTSTVDKVNAMTAHNLLLKINSKIAGVNHILASNITPPVLQSPCMIVGADVTHPSPGEKEIPSIAAVAASYDRYGFQYNMMYRLQRSREEMICDLEDIIKTQLLFFYRRTGQRKPEKILYYRDGVSEGQFQTVLNAEFDAIKRACRSMGAGYNPGVTFLVVQKRHHARFFPNERDGDRKNCNVPAGTLVNTNITHPKEMDFYLVSHQSIQGTARPTKYHLLRDENDISDSEIERLTYYLCFLFSRCNRSVSYPAPTYYAHLAAFRAREWWKGVSLNMADLQQEQRNKGTISENIVNNTPMFFV